ncbi:hypothetical protein ACF0H5_005430 [Mactra antiquata]
MEKLKLEDAVESFQSILSNLKQNDVEQFLLWTKDTVNGLLDDMTQDDNSDVVLKSIREDIRKSLPVEAMTSTENIITPKTGPNADCDPNSTVHVDAFLYDEDTIDDLVDDGKMSRNYCVQCLSKQVKPLTFITHSASMTQMKYIFQCLLQDLRNKTVLDVGSRTGALLYSAYLYSEAKTIIGVELDPTFCELQSNLIEKYNMSDRIKIVPGDILAQTELLQTSDVIIFNNVFEFFVAFEQQQKIWEFLIQTIRKKDTILVTIPSIEESLSSLQASFCIDTWLKKVNISELKDMAVLKYFKDSSDSDIDDIHLYQVI